MQLHQLLAVFTEEFPAKAAPRYDPFLLRVRVCVEGCMSLVLLPSLREASVYDKDKSFLHPGASVMARASSPPLVLTPPTIGLKLHSWTLFPFISALRCPLGCPVHCLFKSMKSVFLLRRQTRWFRWLPLLPRCSFCLTFRGLFGGCVGRSCSGHCHHPMDPGASRRFLREEKELLCVKAKVAGYSLVERSH